MVIVSHLVLRWQKRGLKQFTYSSNQVTFTYLVLRFNLFEFRINFILLGVTSSFRLIF